MELFWVFAGFGMLTFLALAGVALIIVASRRSKSDHRP
jgi:hypothetical protein